MSGKIGLFHQKKKGGDKKATVSRQAQEKKSDVVMQGIPFSFFPRQPLLTAKSENDIRSLQDLIEVNPLDIDLQVVVVG